MTLTITDFLNRNKNEIDQTVDLTDARMKVEPGRYTSMFPRLTIADESIVQAKFRGNAPFMVQILAEGQEPVATRKRATMATVTLSDFRMGFKHVWTLEDRKMVRRVSETQNAQIQNEIRMYFLTTMAEKIRDLNFTGDRLCHILSLTGFVDFLDPLTNLRVRMDYRPDMNLTVQTPAPLVGGAQWQNPATATPLSDLRRWSNDFYENSGTWERPSGVDVSYTVAEWMKNTTEVKLQVQKLRGYYSDVLTSYDTDMVTDAELRSVVLKYAQIQESELAFTIDNKRISQEQADGTVVDVPFFSDQTGNSNYVRFRFGTTSVEQNYIPVPENEFRPGLYTKIYRDESQLTHNEWFGGVGNMIPVIRDARKIFAVKVGP